MGATIISDRDVAHLNFGDVTTVAKNHNENSEISQLDSGSNLANTTTYTGRLVQSKPTGMLTQTQLKTVELVHGEPTLIFDMEERKQFAREEGLHQEIVVKVSV